MEEDLSETEGFPERRDPSDQPDETPETPETPEPPAPVLAEPGMYVCEQEDPGVHPILGQLQTGENDFSSVSDPLLLAAIAELVEAGVLTGPSGAHESGTG